ncbi:MAG: hypothetical protein WCR98_06740 [Saccharofermentanales bacterium]|jgi:hypothetical protein
MVSTSTTHNIPYQEWNFALSNGETAVQSITDRLINTAAAAEARAKSEFLKNGYRNKWVTFKTYRTDLSINQIINVRGLPYLVKDIQIMIDPVKIVSQIKAVRYE